MEITQNIFTTAKLNLDLNQSLGTDSDIHYMLNGQISSHTNSEYDFFIQNLNSNEKCIEFGTEILGVIKLDNDNYSVFIKDEIFLVDLKNCQKVSIATSHCFNFGTNIRGVYKFGQYGRTIYWRDDNNPLRYLHIDKVPPKKKLDTDCNTCKEEYSKEIDCEQLLVWKNVYYPQISLKKGNGRIPSGKYQIAVALTDNKSRISDYFIYPDIFTISPTEKSSLNINFECFKGIFEEFELVLITHREDRGTVAQKIGYYNTGAKSVTINEIDRTDYIPIDTKVLYSIKPYYQGFKHIEVNGSTTEGNLVLGGLTERNPVNWWKEVLEIQGEWVEVHVPAKDAHLYPSLLRDEVYSFEIDGIYPDGQLTEKFHLTCKTPLKPEWDIDVTNEDSWVDNCNNKPRKYWEVYNTAEITNCTLVTKTKQVDICTIQLEKRGTVYISYKWLNGSSIETIFSSPAGSSITIPNVIKDSFTAHVINEESEFEYHEINCINQTVTYLEEVCTEVPYGDLCEYKLGKRGKFAYWESDLKYPDHKNFGNLACTGIRHFKMPDNKVSPHHYTDKDGKEWVVLLTVKFSNIKKPKDCEGKEVNLVGYRIHVTDRQNNKSILHKGLISNMWKEELADCSTSYFNNFPFNDLNPNVFLSKTKTHGDIRNSFKPVTDYSKDRFFYTSPDVDYVRNTTAEELIIYSEEWGKVRGNFYETKEFPEIKFLTDGFYGALSGITVGTFLVQTIGFFTGGGTGTSSLPIILDSYYNIMKGFLPYDNYGINSLVYGDYKNSEFTQVKQGNIRRKIEYANYLLSSKQIQNNDKINNYNREQGIYLKLNKEIENPNVKEYSRVRTKDANCTEFGRSYVFNPATGQPEEAKCSSYYVGFKNYLPTQYGNLNNSVSICKYFTFEWKEETDLIFAGDVYITKHKKLRKFPFFTVLPADGYNDVGINLSKNFNVWKPRFWFNYTQKNPVFEGLKNIPGISGLVNLFDKSPFNLEYGNERDKLNCGDEFNCVTPSTGDGGNLNGRIWRNDGSIYTHIVGIQDYWCESEFIADYREVNEIPESNLEVDETSLVKYNRIEYPELSLYNLQYLWGGVFTNNITANTEVSCCCDQNTDENRVIFSLQNNIESGSDKWLQFPINNYHQFSNTYGKMIGIKQVNEGGLMFIFEDAVYMTQPSQGILTETGLAYLGEGDIFKRNMIRLPGSQDLDSFISTPYGIYWCNKKTKQFYFYDGKLNNITDNIRSWSNEFLNGPIIGIYDNLTESIYWSSKHWTLSYKPKAQSWVSFHSFLPDRYIEMSNNFSTVKGSSIWRHNKKYDYQEYYGVRYPFIVGFTVNNKFEQRDLQSVEIYADFIKEHGYASKEYTKEFFQKIVAYSQRTSTGWQELVSNKIEDSSKSKLPKFTSLNEGRYRINNFKNFAESQPITRFENQTWEFPNTNTYNEGAISGYINSVMLQSTHNLKLLLKLNLSVQQQNIK